jgi:peptide/nickel transport system substrate-binding protein
MMRTISILSLLCLLANAAALPRGGELRVTLSAEPRTLEPNQVEEEHSHLMAYLTHLPLVRINRLTQVTEGAAAASWKIEDSGRRLRFQLRKGMRFSDGTPFDAEDVAHTMRTILASGYRSPVADALRSAAQDIRVEVINAYEVVFHCKMVLSDGVRALDSIYMLSSRSGRAPRAGLGPFQLSEVKAGKSLRLLRNPYFWRRENGEALPRLDSILFEILPSHDLSLMRFVRGETHIPNTLTPEGYERLLELKPQSTVEKADSLDFETLWFNQSSAAGLADYKRKWFRNREFRRAISMAIHREDIVQLVLKGRAIPAAGPVSPANRFWCNTNLQPMPWRPQEAEKLLLSRGFYYRNVGASRQLFDHDGNAVEFSLMTNAGNKSRERTALLVQQDLKRIGIRVNVETIDFPSLVERIQNSLHYEACLLGMVNVELDPISQANVWMSSGRNHPWYPSQSSPGTPWEAEIDRQMQTVTTSPDQKARKKAFDRVQEILHDQQPILFLMHRRHLLAVSSAVVGLKPAAQRPFLLWNAEMLALPAELSRR